MDCRRIVKYAGCSEETIILALIYMDQARVTIPRRGAPALITHAAAGQVVQFNPEFVIISLNIHRLLITR